MAQILPKFEEARTWEELCRHFGELLHLNAPAPLAAVRRAMQDDKYAHYLMSVRESPSMLRILLDDPRNQEYEAPKPAEITQSQGALVAKAAEALVKWGKAGFKRVDDETYQQRWSACQACPNLVDPPELPIYKALSFQKSDLRICALCGCTASRKAQVPTERCPDEDPSNPAVNRWGQARNR